MQSRTMLAALLLPLLFAIASLVAVERVLAGCNTPRPPPPRKLTPLNREGFPSSAPGGRTGAGTPGDRRTGPGTGGTFGFAGSWRVWWNFNREHLLELSGINGIEAPGAEHESAVDPIAGARLKARAALERVAMSKAHEDIRAAALCALGREGNPGKAEVFLRILKAPNRPGKVLEGAAIGLAMLPSIEREAHREFVRNYFDALLMDRVKMPGQSRLISLLALSMRGRSDPALVRIMGRKLEQAGIDANEASELLLASGLPKSELASLLLVQVAASGGIGKRRLTDVARSHAALALALTGGADAAPTLLRLLDAEGVQEHTRRSAALGLGRLLEAGGLSLEVHGRIGKALRVNMVDDVDPLVRSFSVVALGLAKLPYDHRTLMKCLTDRGDATSKPYAALALGLATRNLPAREAGQVREFLIAQLRESRGYELPGALAMAIGLAGATNGADLIAGLVTDRTLNTSVRGPACQALGLLGGTEPDHEKALLIALHDKSDEVAQNAALGLGLRGGENSAMLLVQMLSETRSPMMQAHMVTGLSHLEGAEVIGPLIELLVNAAKKRNTRVSAATALGLIISRRERDLLFELDAHTNPWGLTEASRELALVF